MINAIDRLRSFQTENIIFTKGTLSLVVQFTRLVSNRSYPLNSDDFQTGGRTSRGSMGLMLKYVDFLNAWNAEETFNIEIVEHFWLEQVVEYFRNQPFVLTAYTTRTIGANLDDLFEQAKRRQTQNPGTQYMGTVLQHLVAAKLYLILPIQR